jgi:hypothetical protein
MIPIDTFRSMTPHVWRHARTYSPKFQFYSLAFFLYIAAAANIDGTITNRNSHDYLGSIVVTLLILIVIVLWNQRDNYESSATLNLYLTILTTLGVGAGLFLYILWMSGGTPQVLHLIQLITPPTCIFLFYLLTYNKHIQSDKWQLIGKGISTYAMEKKVIAILPQWEKGNFAYRYIFPANLNEIMLLKNSPTNNKIKLQYASFFFLKDDSSTRHNQQFQVPSESTYQSLDSKHNLSIPDGLPTLESNSLVHLLLAQLFSNFSEQNNKVHYDLKIWLDDHQGKRITFQSDDEKGEEITVFHKWSPIQLRTAAERLIEAYIEPTSIGESARIRYLFHKNLINLSKESYDSYDALMMFISALSIYDKDTTFSLERWSGMMSTFASSRTIIQKLCESEKNKYDSQTDITVEKLGKTFEDYTKQIIRINRNPVENFVNIHDSIVKMTDNDSEFLFYFNQVIHKLMDELQRTKYRQRLIDKGKYTSHQLTEMRKGLVAGTSLSLLLLKERMGG